MRRNETSPFIYDFVCIGFGPAGLALAIALWDDIEIKNNGKSMDEQLKRSRTLFVDQRLTFGWHTGMLLPGAKMQISFLKDLATQRNPRSKFTFINYLKETDKLEDFIDLNTFNAPRCQFNDYFAWCAKHFDSLVVRGKHLKTVSPVVTSSEPEKIMHFHMNFNDINTNEQWNLFAKNVVLATGQHPNIPLMYQPFTLKTTNSRIVHSSEYSTHLVPHIKAQETNDSLKIAIVGAGQSAAEIVLHALQTFPKHFIILISRAAFLHAADSSPFVNQIFRGDFVQKFYATTPQERQNILEKHRYTNYSCIQPDLLEQLYSTLYNQSLDLTASPRLTIYLSTNVMQVNQVTPNHPLTLDLARNSTFHATMLNRRIDSTSLPQHLEVDYLVLATGYTTPTHHSILQNCSPYFQQSMTTNQSFPSPSVNHDYSLNFKPNILSPHTGIYLQGACESTHGLSDSLLSVLSIRAAQLLPKILPSSPASEN